MLKDLYELKSRTLQLKLGEEVEETIEFDLMVDSVTIIIPATLDNNQSKPFFYHINALDLPNRHESNGSMLITLKEIADYIEKNQKIDFFTMKN